MLTTKGAFPSPIGMISRSEITAVEDGLSVMDKDIMGLAEG
ncbi:hypothetical protein Agau_C200229 [Agrobacterium tumefaciens F2]|nr:hypothetical protein Agau_C200229 [Agrobacterium tumefaciens F2]